MRKALNHHFTRNNGKETTMKVMKRNGAEVSFDPERIIKAVSLANDTALKKELSDAQIRGIAANVTKQCELLHRAVSVEEIQDMVERAIMEQDAPYVAQHYIHYRLEHNRMRQENSTDDRILTLVDNNSEDIKQENSNKDSVINSVQRDYIAGETSRDITMRKLLPPDVVDAHNSGIIHFHDSDYYIQHMHNCDLVNLKDMLMNGTVISETFIDQPNSFSTACNIATQIIAQVASNQYGGQSISLTHLVPFVEKSRRKIAKDVLENAEIAGVHLDVKVMEEIVEKRLRKEVEKGVQTIRSPL